jgi:hypothetical protein
VNRKLLPSDTETIRQWRADLCDFSSAQIRAGVQRTKDFTGFFTLPAFRALCRQTPDDFGLPDTETAYREACCKALPWGHQTWSHAAVYAAARETGCVELGSMTERECLPLFRRNYDAMCARVLAGERFDMPVQRSLSVNVTVFNTREQNKNRLAELRLKFDL